MARGKRFRAAYEKVDRNHAYEPGEAIDLLKQTASAKFDETVELHIRLGVNVRHAEEQVRGTLALPHGTGGDVTVAVFAEGDKAREANEAGADFVGADDLAERVEAGWTDFDVAIATPDQMPKVGKLGRVLGPQGLMPNPKVGTVTMDVAKAVEESKSGKIEYRTDRQAVIHLTIGKASFDSQALLENYAAVIDEIVKVKPAAAKGRYLLSVTVTSTMGPGIKVDTGRQTAGEVLAAAGVIDDPEDIDAASNGGGDATAVMEPGPAAEEAEEAETDASGEDAGSESGETSAQADAIASLEERAAEAEAEADDSEE
jgi:large subunit ribosomal protein L1